MGIIIDNKLILKKIREYYKFESDAEFAKHLGIKPNTLSNWYNRNSIDYLKIITNCEDIDANWLLTGEGNMLKENNQKKMIAEPARSYRKTADKIYPVQQVPVFNLDATMGLVPMINENGIDEDKIIDFISIPNLPSCDGATSATGDSMYPLLKAGDLIAYKRIALEPNSIFYGEIYLLSIKIDETSTYKTIKFVQKSELGPEYLRLVSQNQHHPPMDIEIKQIAAIALVRASIRIHN